MMTRKRFLLLPGLGLLLVALLLLAQKELLDLIVPQPQHTAAPTVTVSPLVTLPNYAVPVWYDNTRFVYAQETVLNLLDLDTLQSNPFLPPFPVLINEFAAQQNMVYIETSLPFSETKTRYLYRDGKLTDFDLSKYGHVRAFSFTPSNKLAFIGLYSPSTNTGNLYLYDVASGEFSSPLYTDLRADAINWLTDQQAVIYVFSEASERESLSILNLSSPSTPTLTSFGSEGFEIMSYSLSSNNSQLLIVTEKFLQVVPVSDTRSAKQIPKENVLAFWLDQERLLLLPKNSIDNFTVYNLVSQKEYTIPVPQPLATQSILFSSQSPDFKTLLVQTKDHAWYAIDLSPL